MPSFTPATVTLPPLSANTTSTPSGSGGGGQVQYLYGDTNPIEVPLTGFLGNASVDAGTTYPPVIGDLVAFVDSNWSGTSGGVAHGIAGCAIRAEDFVGMYSSASTALTAIKQFVGSFLGVAMQALRATDRFPFGNSTPQAVAVTPVSAGAPFPGVGNSGSNSGNTGATIRVATSGVFQFPVDTASQNGTAFAVGDLVAPGLHTGQDKLSSQSVQSVSKLSGSNSQLDSAAIGEVVEAAPANATYVKIRILSTKSRQSRLADFQTQS
jgi:hypothetical protein